MRRSAALVAAIAALAACSQPRHPVADIRVAEATLSENVLLGLDAKDVEARLRRALEETGRFRFVGPDEKEGAVTLSLEIPFTRESRKEGRDGTFAEVGAALAVRRRADGVFHRYEVAGLGEVQVASADDRGRAMAAALDQALAQIARAANLQLRALGRSDRQLLSDLRGEDSAMREFALRVLSERHHPGVAEVLVERLRTSSDADALRQAIGALAEMREQRAVRPLIELTRGKPPEFVREVIYALAQIGGEEATAYLYTLSQGHDDPQLRAAAAQALSEIDPRGKGASR